MNALDNVLVASMLNQNNMPMNRNNPLLKLGLLTGTTIILFLSLEVCLRIYYASTVQRESPSFFSYKVDPELGPWMDDPEGSRPHINSFGMYDYERNLVKNKEIYRIAVLGDSFMNGVHVGLGSRMSDLIAKYLGEKIEVLNFGISSVGTVHELIIYSKRVKQFNPDLVILGFLPANDIRNNSRTLERASGYGFLSHAPWFDEAENGGLELKKGNEIKPKPQSMFDRSRSHDATFASGAKCKTFCFSVDFSREV